MPTTVLRVLCALACLAGIAAVGPAAAAADVDLALVLAVDISNSMDPEEQELQREGFVEAFRSPLVHDAIRNGMLGRITVVYAEWAASFRQHVVVPWTTIETPEDARSFAERLSRAPIQRGPRTSISGAIDLGLRLLSESGAAPLRQVIDISGDGANNEGRPVTQARDEAIAKGVTINGLPIMLKRSIGYWDVADLDLYYRDCVVGGPGAFMVPVRDRDQFAQAIKTKIIREIADLRPDPNPDARLTPVQAERQTNCLAGEARNWDMMRN